MKTVGKDRIDAGRRRFLSGRFVFRRDRPLGPAPPALLARLAEGKTCAGCDAPCVAACEPGIIRLHAEDHVLAGRPYLSFERSGCTFCNDCVERCPAEAPAAAEPPRLGLARLETEACLAWNGTVCMSCGPACAYEAVQVDARGRPAIDPAACNGCGFCVPACPEQAIRVPS